MNDDEAIEAAQRMRNLFAAANPDQIQWLIDRLEPYPLDAVLAACDEHGEGNVLPKNDILRTVQELAPEVAREQARLAREAMRRRETAAARTAESRDAIRQEGEAAERERGEQLAALQGLAPAEVERLKTAVLAELSPGTASRYREKDPLTFEPLGRLLCAKKWPARGVVEEVAA